MRRIITVAVALATALGLAGPPNEASARIVLLPRIVLVNGSPVVRLLPRFVADPEPAGLLPGLPMISAQKWDETAVRQVMHVFAYGGQATDAQVRNWANMAPDAAIVQMLNFNQHNTRLSKPGPTDNDNLANKSGTLKGLAAHLENGPFMPPGERENFADGSYPSTYHTWSLAARLRGLNPFRQKIGLFETNYHMAVNQVAGVSPYQMIAYYDLIMESLASREPYHRTLNKAALSAAVASQYGHVWNRWYFNWDTNEFECFCNDDFAREYHQLFFGILGVADSEYHERVSIENTSSALTGMYRVPRAGQEEWEAEDIRYYSVSQNPNEGVAPGPFEILGRSIGGDDASARINQLSAVAIGHYESLANLPFIIIQNLADDELSDSEISAIRRAWRSMGNKDLLKFIRAYAVSTLFHSPNRVKHLTSIDRWMLISNLAWHTNAEHYRNLPSDWMLFWEEEVLPFVPHHDVFGHQSGLEAASSAELFRKHWLGSTDRGWRHFNVVETFDDGSSIERSWAGVAPKEPNGSYKVATVARWLWQRFVADGLANYGDLERAQMHALLARGRDFSRVADENDLARIYTGADIAASASLRSLITSLGNETLALAAGNDNVRQIANSQLGEAVAFVTATPFMFVKQGQ